MGPVGRLGKLEERAAPNQPEIPPNSPEIIRTSISRVDHNLAAAHGTIKRHKAERREQHAHGTGRPECFAANVLADGSVRVFIGDRSREWRRDDLQQVWNSATDRSSVVTFAFGATAPEAPHAGLLKLRAC